MLCYCCDPANPDRIAVHDASGTLMRFPARFEGPPGNVNGGMATGALGCPALEAASRDGAENAAITRITARLHRGIPHSRELRAGVSRVDDAYEINVRDGDDVCITGRVEVAPLAQPPGAGAVLQTSAPNLDALLPEMAAVREPNVPPFFEQTGDHPISGCFSCGPSNTRGLHIYPRFAGDGVTWASWSPDPAFVDQDGGLASSIVASALDCSSGICLPREQQEELLRTDQFYLLGSLDVRYLRVPKPDGQYHVVGRARRRVGRKFFGMSALFDDAGTAYATADATWIIVTMTRAQAFGGG
jgi:acyl-coenzyme A thioesterase PaaI-like protein